MRNTPLNAIPTEAGHICRTILATYHKIGTYNVFEHNFPAVLESYETEDSPDRDDMEIPDERMGLP